LALTGEKMEEKGKENGKKERNDKTRKFKFQKVQPHISSLA
jgi:hypothetical protein